MGGVMEFDMSSGTRGRPPARIASRLASGRRTSGAKSTEGPIRAHPPSGRADSKAADTTAGTSRRPSMVSTDSFQSHGRDSLSLRGRGSSDDEAAAKPRARRVPGSPPGYGRPRMDRRGSYDTRNTASGSSTFRMGQKIEGRFRGKGQWYKGIVVGINPGGTYDVRYDDGDEDLGLATAALRAVEDGSFAPARPRESRGAGGRAAGPERAPRIGDRVEARVPGSSRWQRATVVGENRNGSLDVRFRDGTEEKNISTSLVRMLQDSDDEGRHAQGAAGQKSYRVGDEVEARFKGKSRWFSGIVRRVNTDDTYDIRYTDGDEERGVDPSLIRTIDVAGDAEGGKKKSAERFRRGDDVEARFGGRSRWFRARVERENRNGTFHLLYADGDEEHEVERALIRPVGASSPRSGSKSPGRRVVSGASSEANLATHPTFRAGDKIEARYKRGRKWYMGTVRAVGRDGTYDIRYEDGDEEEGVDAGLVRGLGVGSTESFASSAGAKQDDKQSFREGDEVEARFGGRSRWFRATVQRRNRNGTYHLLYADGDEEMAVDKSLIRKDEGKGPRGESKTVGPGRPTLGPTEGRGRSPRAGDEIEARYKRGHKWYPGVVRVANRDGTFDIRYDDGDNERDVDSKLVRLKGGASAESFSSSRSEFSRGDKVEARFGGRSRWYKATVERENRDGTFHLLYEDGDEERSVGKDLIRQRSEGSALDRKTERGNHEPVRSSSGGIDSEADAQKFRVGDAIEARYKRGRKWYPGVIRAVSRNGAYDIRYRDGDVESGVEEALIRGTGRASVDSIASSAPDNDGEGFVPGQRVEARIGRGSTWREATVDRRNRDGTYSLVSDDGDRERAVEQRFIRKLASGRSSERRGPERSPERSVPSAETSNEAASGRVTIRVGDDIEARYRGGRKWYPGVARAVNRDGTYDIRYKDGDTEYDVESSFVRAVSVDSLASNLAAKGLRDEFAVGEKVEARFKGRARWFRASVARVNRDGTYDLEYVDGDEETSVRKNMIRRIDNKSSQDTKEGRQIGEKARENADGERPRVGDQIEARYKRGNKWYPGVVRSVNGDGTYDIRYSDGDSEYDVDPLFVRLEGGARVDKIDAVNDDFFEGDEVEARFKGRSRWFKGTIRRKNSDGTYDLKYADGDEEKTVEKGLIRKAASAEGPKDDSPSARTYRIGDDVEARYKRGRKWYPGTIRAMNRNGTYDIRYKDGDSEREVAVDSIREVGATEADISTGTARGRNRPGAGFHTGDKVEARYRGRSRWFKATVERKNRDGTFHLLYVDGDEETHVDAQLIRALDAGGREGERSRSPGRVKVSTSGTDDERGLGAGRLQKGDDVEARYKRGRKWYPGVIRTANLDGTYDIRYKDGDCERSVDRALIRTKGGGSVEDLPVGTDSLRSTQFLAGDEVEARFGGRSRWFRATVERKNRDGTYHLLYADGDEEERVDKALIRIVDRPREGAEDQRLDESRSRPAGKRANSLDSLDSNATTRHRAGDQAEARSGRGPRCLRATNRRENVDSTYDLTYADGDKERDVDNSFIRTPVKASGEAKGTAGDATAVTHSVGDEIEARYKRGRKWYPGVVRAVNRDGTYDVSYEDGDSERGVASGLTRKVAAARMSQSRSSDALALPAGSRVEARFRGRSRWYSATIDCENRDGTYDLVYDDGDKEKGVDRELVRTIDRGRTCDGSRKPAPVALDSESDARAENMPRGRAGQSPRREADDLLRVGDLIEARFQEGSRWLPGEVSRAHRDGSVDVLYDDGARERDVPARYVRPANVRTRGTGSESDSDRDGRQGAIIHRSAVIVEGDTVEARLHGRSTWHRAKVTRLHSDGTYDVHFKSGDEEKRLESRFVRKPGASSATKVLNSGRHRKAASSPSETEDSREKAQKQREGSRRPPHDPKTSAVALAAEQVRRSLRKAGKTTDDLSRRLERARRSAPEDVVDSDLLQDVLTDLGVKISARDARHLCRTCSDVERDGRIDPLALVELVRNGTLPKGESSAARGRVPTPRKRGDRFSSSGSGSSTPRRSTSGRASRSGCYRSSSPDSDAQRGGSRPRRRGSRSRTPTRQAAGLSQIRASQRRSRTHSSGTSSESQRSLGSSSDERGQQALLSKRAFRALRSLGGPAFDGTLRRECCNMSSDDGLTLETTQLKRFFRRLRIKLDEATLQELISVLDEEEVGVVNRLSLLEAALPTQEGEEVAHVYADIRKRMLASSARGGAKRRKMQKGKDVVSAVSKALSKADHPKGSGLLLTGSLKQLLKKAGASASSAEVQVLRERLDPDDRGKIDREAFIVWLTTGFDLLQAERRASMQLRTLRRRVRTPEKVFMEYDLEEDGVVSEVDFVKGLTQLRLLVPYGQATALGKKYGGDYELFFDQVGGKKRPAEELPESDDSGTGSATSGSRRSGNRARKSQRRSRRNERTGDASDAGSHCSPMQSTEDGDSDVEEEGLLLGKSARAALRDAFERACSPAGKVRDTFHSAGGSREKDRDHGSISEVLTSWEQTMRFIRRLKLDLDDDERAVVVRTLTGATETTRDRGGAADKQGRSRRPSRGSTSDSKRNERGMQVSFRDFLELTVAEQESREVCQMQRRIRKDLTKSAEAKKACPFALVIKAFAKYDRGDGTGFIKVSDFKRGLDKMGSGGLSSPETAALVRRFDPLEEGAIDPEMYAAWLTSGLDIERLTTKLGRLLGQFTGGEKAKWNKSEGARKFLRRGLRGVFEAIDTNREGIVPQHDMKVILRSRLGLPLTEGDWMALSARLDKAGDGNMDYEELLAMAAEKRKGGDSGRDGLLSKLKRSGSAFMKGRTKGTKSDRDAGGANDTDVPSNSDDGLEDDESASSGSDAPGRRRRDKKEKKKKKRKKSQRRNADESGRHARSRSPSKRARREGALWRLRISILQRCADAARDEERDDERRTSAPPDPMDWTASFEGRDHAGTGSVTADDLEAILLERSVQLSTQELSLLITTFVTSTSNGRVDDTMDKAPAKLIDYDALVRWLSEGGGLDDALLSKIQRHLKGRLSKAMDLRSLYGEMSGQGSRRGGDSDQGQLSASRLARGLRHAGLPLDRAVVDQLMAAFSTGRGRGQRLSYPDFHRMVHCGSLFAGGLGGVQAEGDGGFAGRVGCLDEQVRSTLLEAAERAFAFYDEDRSNSIDAAELVTILRALGHEPSRREARALLRKADADRNGVLQYEDFQEAVMPFLLERARSKRLTEAEMRALFDEIDTDASGSIEREEFAYLFCTKLGVLSQPEVDALLSVLDRHQSGHVTWEEFVRLFELMGDHSGHEGAAALNPDVKEVLTVALRKLHMGCIPDVEGELSSFLGMPSTCRKSVIAPLDKIKELSLRWVLEPKLDSRGCIQLQDMSVKLTTEVAEVEATQAPLDDPAQVLVKTTNLADRDSVRKHKGKPPQGLSATLGLRKRDLSPPPAVTTSKGTKTRRRSSILGMGLMETTTTVTKRAELQEVGASTEEGKRGRLSHDDDVDGVMQVELSVKHAFGIPVAKDSRLGDIRQRGMRACLFYNTRTGTDGDVGESTSETREHFLCNTYKTLAVQHPQKEEQWLFPDSTEGERKFLVRTDFGSADRGDDRRNRRGSRSHRQGVDDGSSLPGRRRAAGSRDSLYLLVELTCTVQTSRGDEDSAAPLRGGGLVSGPFKNFRTRSSSRLVRRMRGDRSRSRRSESTSDQGSGADDNASDVSYDQQSKTPADTSSGSSGGSSSDSESRLPRRGRRGVLSRRSRSVPRERRAKRSSRSSSASSSGGSQKHGGMEGRRRQKDTRKSGSAPPVRRRKRSLGGASRHANVLSEGSLERVRDGRGRRRVIRRKSIDNGDGNGDDGADSASSSDRNEGERRGHSAGARRTLAADFNDNRRGGEAREETIEAEISYGWVLIPFMELVEAQEVKKTRYKLSGGTPFAETAIKEEEVMTRRYGWRALLKAMKIEGMHKRSEIELKIIPVGTLSKAKQEDIFRLPRNVVLSDTFVSLVRYYREYTANRLAKRSAKGLGNAGFGAGSASSEPVLALFPRLAADPALMMALKNQWDTEVRKSHADSTLGATLAIGLGLTIGAGVAKGAALLRAFERAVMRLWPAYCHIDAQKRRLNGGVIGAESYEDLEERSQRIRQILESRDSFRSDTPSNSSNVGDIIGGRRPGGNFFSPVSQERGVMVAFTLKEVAFGAA